MTSFRIALLGAVASLALPAAAGAQSPVPITDLGTVIQGLGSMVPTAPIQDPPAPSYDPAPPAPCAAGARPQPSIDGRVPAGSADKGLWCNLTMIAHQGTSGGFKVLRYVDPAGHECAYYDTALLFPTNALNVNSNGIGVVVLDMADPAKPVQTATLTTPSMLSPHESVNLNQARGLLAAVNGNPSTYPGYVDVYDLHTDCRHPVLDYGGLLAPLGHESGFSVDGKTFYATGTSSKSITAIDLTDPKNPHVVEQMQIESHGMSLSEDGNRAYVADTSGNMLILDTSQIQARKADPQVREISRLTWPRASIPQNAIPFTEDGHPYILEFDEYTAGLSNNGSGDDVGAGRIIDIADEKAPKVVANLRLAVNNPEEHKKYGGDPGAYEQENGFVQGYAAHYCNIPTRVNPKLVACSFIVSGLRVFDISTITKPREVGYFVAPTQAKFENGESASDFAMSMPAFVPDRHEIWWTDGTSGFYVLRVAAPVWNAATKASSSAPKAICASKRRFAIHLPAAVRTARVYVDGKRVAVRRVGLRLRAIVDLRKKLKKTVTVRIVGRTKDGKAFRDTRRYHTCRPGS